MKIKALVSFSGALSMKLGEVREIENKVILKDLLRAKYIEELIEKPNKEDELKKEIENLKKELEELKKVPEAAPDAKVKSEGEKVPEVTDQKKVPAKDVKPDESKSDNSK